MGKNSAKVRTDTSHYIKIGKIRCTKQDEKEVVSSLEKYA